MRNNAFVVTIVSNNNPKSKIWDAKSPLSIGHPFRWVIDRESDVIKIKNIYSLSNGKEFSFDEKIVSEDMLNSLIELPGLNPEKTFIKLNKVPKIESVTSMSSKSGDVTAFTKLGNWIQDSLTVENNHVFTSQGKKIFSIEKTGNYQLTSFTDKLKISGNQSYNLSKNESIVLNKTELLNLSINFNSNSWVFRQTLSPKLVLTNDLPPTEEQKFFKNALKYSLLGTLSFLVLGVSLSSLLHSGNNEELIPAQYTKIVMTKDNGSSEKAESSPQVSKKDGQVKKNVRFAQNTAVVQAFRAKALKNSISGLLKGGMTKLLSESDFVVGKDSTASAKTLFNSKDSSARATGDIVGTSSFREVKVASIGGSGSGEGPANHVGYGHGEHAKVGGQGHSLINVDTNLAAVEEGLTKDEVGEVIHRHLSEIRYCYETALVRSPDVEGKLVVNFTVGSYGEVKSDAIKTSTLPDPRLDDCILRRLATWKFPKTKGGIDVAVTYPFIFKTIGDKNEKI